MLELPAVLPVWELKAVAGLRTVTSIRTGARPPLADTPDSVTSELKGIYGKMTIDIVDGKHLYTFDYDLGAEA